MYVDVPVSHLLENLSLLLPHLPEVILLALVECKPVSMPGHAHH